MFVSGAMGCKRGGAEPLSVSRALRLCVWRAGPSKHFIHFLVKQLRSCCKCAATSCSVIGVLLCPLAGLLNCTRLIVLPVVSHSLVEWVIDVWSGHQGLDREQNGLDLESGRPLVLKDVKADSSCSTHEQVISELVTKLRTYRVCRCSGDRSLS